MVAHVFWPRLSGCSVREQFQQDSACSTGASANISMSMIILSKYHYIIGVIVIVGVVAIFV